MKVFIKSIIRLLRLLILFICLIISCTNPTNKYQIKKSKTDDSSEILSLTIAWNEGLKNRKLEELRRLYDKQVLMYGYLISREGVISSKADFFLKYNDFTQEIIGGIQVKKMKKNRFKSSFKKETKFNGKTIIVDSYLIFENTFDGLKIIVESDKLTDKNKLSPKEKKRYKSSVEVVEDIVTSSKVFKKLTKDLKQRIINNGGNGFGLHFEGDRELDKFENLYKTYNFVLFENY